MIEISQMETIQIWCMKCKQSVTLDESIRTQWKYCAHCHFFLCPQCYHEIDNDLCPSSFCSSRKNRILVEPIPIESIILFSKEQSVIDDGLDRESLVYKMFYKEEYLTRQSFESLKLHKEMTQVKGECLTREEIWKNNKIVLTQRRNGKFVAWQKIM